MSAEFSVKKPRCFLISVMFTWFQPCMLFWFFNVFPLALKRIEEKISSISSFTEKHTTGNTHGKESACDAGDPVLISGLGRSPGKVIDNPLQYSCLENSIDRGTWQVTVHGLAESDTTDQITLTYTTTNNNKKIIAF